ncbi:hypothetical protein T459_06530 [Capsicum annuum]|uniref:Transcription factor GTE7-like n=1 Tax=Capsicum annuum TaxID=4072 RepID=A0A2G3AB02_CAPAN|nr:hypothetical protein T459_06530 [Capsicum annuum]
MASAVLAGVNEPHWDERNAYMRKYTTSNPTAHSQLHSRFNPNPNPSPNFSFSRQVQNGPAASHRRQVNEQLPRAVPSPPAPMANNNAVVDRNDSFHREYVTFNLASYSRSELKDLKKRLISDLGRVRGLLSRIEAQDFVSGASFHAREVIQPPAAPQLQQIQPALPSKPELVGRKNKKLTGQKRPRAMATRKDTKRPVVEGDKFFVSMMRSCRQILIKLMSKKDSYWFNSPVDVKGMNLYDYFDIIKHPMDLGTVKSRLDKKEYRTPQDFAADVRLTFNNAMTYNLKGQRVHTLAEECLGLFEKLFNLAYEKYEDEHRKVAAIMQVKPQKNLPQPALIPPPNALHQQLPVARKSDSVRLQSTLLNQHQFQVPVAPIFATPTPALKSPPHPVITTPSSAKLPKPKAKDPNKRQMTFEEKVKLGADLQDLPLVKLDHALQIVKKKTPNLTQDGNEIELDFELIDNETMWELERFVGYHKKAMSKMRRQGVTEDAAVVQLNKVKKVFGFVICMLTNLYIVPCYLITLLHFVKKKSPEKAPTPEPAMPKNKKVDVVEEDVDIGEEIPGESFPPVQIDKDVPCESGGSSSSSGGSSSGSDSSSSDSDSGSSSGSDSDEEDSVQSPFVEAAKEAPTT